VVLEEEAHNTKLIHRCKQNNFLLAISLACMGLQIVAFYLLAHHQGPRALKL
jgi:hypothetical protein